MVEKKYGVFFPL